MYLLLITQDLDNEIGLMYPNFCLQMCSDLQLRTQVVTDLRLKKALDQWIEKHSWNTTLEGYWDEDSGTYNTLNIVKGVVRGYANPLDKDKWNDLFSAGLSGLVYALSNFDSEKGILKYHIRRNVRNYVINELRKIKRWSNEVSFSNVGLDDTFSVDQWNNKEPKNQEETVMHKEDLEKAYQHLAEVLEDMNERERYVVYNYILSDDPIPMRKLALYFKCSKDAILRDIKRMRRLLKKGKENDLQ